MASLGKGDNRLAPLILAGLFALLLLAVTGVAPLQAWDQIDDDDLSFMDSRLPGSSVDSFPPALVFFSIEWVGAASLLILECLRSHIGEKRPSGPVTAEDRSSADTAFLKTTLFYRVVFLLPVAPIFDGGYRLAWLAGPIALGNLYSKEVFIFMQSPVSSRFVQKSIGKGGL